MNYFLTLFFIFFPLIYFRNHKFSLEMKITLFIYYFSLYYDFNFWIVFLIVVAKGYSQILFWAPCVFFKQNVIAFIISYIIILIFCWNKFLIFLINKNLLTKLILDFHLLPLSEAKFKEIYLNTKNNFQFYDEIYKKNIEQLSKSVFSCGNTVFHIACSSNIKVEWIEYFKETLNKKNKEGNTPFHIATKLLGNTTLKKFLELKAQSNIKNNEGDTPFLFFLKYHNHVNQEILDLFLSNKADINIEDKQKKTAFHYICIKNNEETFKNIDFKKLFHNYGAKINSLDENFNTPFHFICNHNNIDLSIVKTFIESSSDPNTLNRKNYSAFHNFVSKDQKINCVNYLSPISNPLFIDNRNALYYLIDTKTSLSLKTIQTFLDKKISVNTQNLEKDTLLHVACQQNNLSPTYLSFLINIKSDPNKKNLLKHTPLHYLVMKKKLPLSLVKIYLTSPIKVDFSKNTRQLTPITIATNNKKQDIVFLFKYYEKHNSIWSFEDFRFFTSSFKVNFNNNYFCFFLKKKFFLKEKIFLFLLLNNFAIKKAFKIPKVLLNKIFYFATLLPNFSIQSKKTYHY